MKVLSLKKHKSFIFQFLDMVKSKMNHITTLLLGVVFICTNGILSQQIALAIANSKSFMCHIHLLLIIYLRPMPVFCADNFLFYKAFINTKFSLP